MIDRHNSKKLSYLLRHKPESANLTIDKEGWVLIQELVDKTDFTKQQIFQIVQEDEKARYAIRDALYVRANQGHSTPKVQMYFKKAIPPVTLYHGTTVTALSEILRTGLKSMNRHHVHLTSDENTAKTVGGRRRSDAVVLSIDCAAMLKDDIPFYKSENNVWLVTYVDPKYILAPGKKL